MFVPNTIPAEGLLIVKFAVSIPSINASLATVNVTVPVVCPLGMVMVVPLRL